MVDQLTVRGGAQNPEEYPGDELHLAGGGSCVFGVLAVVVLLMAREVLLPPTIHFFLWSLAARMQLV
jgi:hypothetical protein